MPNWQLWCSGLGHGEDRTSWRWYVFSLKQYFLWWHSLWGKYYWHPRLRMIFMSYISLIGFVDFSWWLFVYSWEIIDTKLSGSRCFAGWKWYKWSNWRTKWKKKLYIITGSLRTSLLGQFQSSWRFYSIFFSRYNKYVSVHHSTNPYTGSLVRTFLSY